MKKVMIIIQSIIFHLLNFAYLFLHNIQARYIVNVINKYYDRDLCLQLYTLHAG